MISGPETPACRSPCHSTSIERQHLCFEYLMWVNQNGVTVDRYQQGNGKIVRQFDNPGINVVKNPGITITVPSAQVHAVPGYL